MSDDTVEHDTTTIKRAGSYRSVNGAKLRALATSRGFTAGLLAYRLNVSKTTIVWWFSGRRSPAAHRLDALATVLGTSVDDLLI